ncbi:hypothetical protein [Chondromyces crocatus]|uniref:Band 7 domain-containing protein n=1 Tax=Chondromyces crocatus TaxID=52 RepID=A0A0K1EK79_CHOCO|nr:hypothetical protein [Chondromyces crocatus]AKT41269.1 uncharacterized protein CMC5_054360 [Chondromyces crocatus]
MSEVGTRRRRWLLIGLLLVAALVAAVVFFSPREELYATFTRPDGQYRVEVYRRPLWFGVFPGQGSDAPGRAVLKDRAGQVLGDVEVEMVQIVSGVEWEEHSASIRAVAHWKLP